MNPFAEFENEATRPDTLPEGERALVQRFRPVGATGRKACVIGDDSFLARDLITRLIGEGYEVAYVADPVWSRTRHEFQLEIDCFEPNVLEEAVEGADHLFVVHYRFRTPDERLPGDSAFRISGERYVSVNAGRYYFLQARLQRVLEEVKRPPETVVCAYPRVGDIFEYSFAAGDGLLQSTPHTGVASIEFGALMDHQYGAWYGAMCLLCDGIRPRKMPWPARKRARRENVQPWISTQDLVSLIVWTAFERNEGHLKGFAPDCPRESSFFETVLNEVNIKAIRGSTINDFLRQNGWTHGFTGAGAICDYSAAETLGFQFQDPELRLLCVRLLYSAMDDESNLNITGLMMGIHTDTGDTES